MFGVLDELEMVLEKLVVSEEPLDVVRLSRLRNQLEFVWLRAVGEFDRSRDWRAERFVNAASALRVKCGIDQGVAHAEVNLARKLADLPVVSEAFAQGVISRRHARVIGDACTAERAPAIAQLEEAIVAVARAATPKQLGQVVDQVTGALDGDDGASVANEYYERRELFASRTTGGVAGRFFLPGDDGEMFLNALSSAQDTYRADDTRSPAQRRADALVELVRVGVAHFERGPGRERPGADVTAVIDLGEIEARGGHDVALEIRARRGGRLSKATLRRITCDARIARVITDGPSQVLDVGRATRTIPTALWRALVARDGGCSTAGCDRPPEWCEVHHIIHWADGGETNLENTTLKCGRHHRDEHEGGHDPP